MSAVMGVYRSADLAFEKGEGVYLTGTDGRRYLDFNAGIAVSGLGHAHPHLVAALKAQGEKLWHTSNLYTIPEQVRLAERLAAATFADKVFFTNSGVEAFECAVKTARRYMYDSGHPDRYEIIALKQAFHGRSLAAINATGKADGFGPPLPGFTQVEPGDLDAVRAAITDKTAGIMVEPVQGEGGVVPLPMDYLRGLRALCDDRGLLLILDEVQCGMGRTGKLFAHEWAGTQPDIMAVAKGVGGGFPFGACLSTEEAAIFMVPGTHGSTYGGNPLAIAVGNAVLDVMLAPGFLEHVQEISAYLRDQMEAFAERRHNQIESVRGMGLMMGLKLRDGLNNREVMARALENGLMLAPAGDNVLRFLPPLIIERPHVDEALDKLGRAMDSFETEAA